MVIRRGGGDEMHPAIRALESYDFLFCKEWYAIPLVESGRQHLKNQVKYMKLSDIKKTKKYNSGMLKWFTDKLATSSKYHEINSSLYVYKVNISNERADETRYYCEFEVILNYKKDSRNNITTEIVQSDAKKIGENLNSSAKKDINELLKKFKFHTVQGITTLGSGAKLDYHFSTDKKEYGQIDLGGTFSIPKEMFLL